MWAWGRAVAGGIGANPTAIGHRAVASKWTAIVHHHRLAGAVDRRWKRWAMSILMTPPVMNCSIGPLMATGRRPRRSSATADASMVAVENPVAGVRAAATDPQAASRDSPGNPGNPGNPGSDRAAVAVASAAGAVQARASRGQSAAERLPRPACCSRRAPFRFALRLIFPL